MEVGQGLYNKNRNECIKIQPSGTPSFSGLCPNHLGYSHSQTNSRSLEIPNQSVLVQNLHANNLRQVPAYFHHENHQSMNSGMIASPNLGPAILNNVSCSIENLQLLSSID
jgi:hypothetical protein